VFPIPDWPIGVHVAATRRRLRPFPQLSSTAQFFSFALKMN
jgi:hypothetical protein